MSFVQTAITALYRKPKSKLREIQRQGGFKNVRQTKLAQKEMVKASKNIIVPKNTKRKDGIILSFLTGKRYWYQTVFCIYSLVKSSPSTHFIFHIYDDGTIDAKFSQQIKNQVPNVQIHLASEVQIKLDKYLPEDRYPFLRNKRLIYPHIKKLTDIHVGNQGYQVVADSDMLFFQEPVTLLNYMENPTKPFYILDKIQSYGYTDRLLTDLSGSTIQPKVNVGLLGLKSEDIDWGKIEYWGKTLEEKEGTSYYLEQALSAMIIGNQESVIGNPNDYIVYPNKEQIFSKKGVLHHYVDLSKEWYFKQAWRTIL